MKATIKSIIIFSILSTTACSVNIYDFTGDASIDALESAAATLDAATLDAAAILDPPSDPPSDPPADASTDGKSDALVDAQVDAINDAHTDVGSSTDAHTDVGAVAVVVDAHVDVGVTSDAHVDVGAVAVVVDASVKGTPDTGEVSNDASTDSSLGTTSEVDASGVDAHSFDSGVDANLSNDATAKTDAIVLTSCSGILVDLETDPDNCGKCGYVAQAGRTCVSGRPSPAWLIIPLSGAPPARTLSAASSVLSSSGHPTVVISGGSPTYTGMPTNYTSRFDMTTNSWMPLGNPLNTHRCGHGSVSDGTKIYIWGGLADCSDPTTTGAGGEEYDPSNDSWTQLDNINSTFVYDMSMTWIPSISRIFIWGGYNNSVAIPSGGFLNVSNNNWGSMGCNSLSDCARAGNLSSFVTGNAIYIMGDSDTYGLKYDFSILDFSDWPLPVGTPNPLPKRYADDGRRIYYLRGTGSCPDNVTILTYDRVTNSWLSPDISVPPSGLAAEAATAWSGNELFAWSGICNSGDNPVSVGGRYQPPAPTN